MTSYQNRQLNHTRYIYKHLGHTNRRMLVCIYLYASIYTVAPVYTRWLPFAGSLAQLCTKLYESCMKILFILYASLNAPTPVHKSGCYFTCMQAMVLIYLYASPDAPILVCNQGAPIPVCKPWRFYTCV